MNAQGLDAQGKEVQVEKTKGGASSPLQHWVMLVFSFFGYCKKPPVEIVQLSIEQEVFFEEKIKNTVIHREYYEKYLEGQQAITQHLRSMRK